MAINFTLIDQAEVREELIKLFEQTKTFKDARFAGSNLFTLTNVLSYNATLFGYYLNQIANEPFLDSAKLYKNANRIANNLRYNPIGKGSAIVPIASKLSKNYVLANNEGFIEIPTYSQFPSTKTTIDGESFTFTNINPLAVQVRQFGVSYLKQGNLKYVGEITSGNILNDESLKLPGDQKNPTNILDSDGNLIGEVKHTISSRKHDTLPSFLTNVEYSLIIQQELGSFILVIYPKTVTPLTNEIIRFKVTSNREVIVTQSFAANRVYKGRLGFRNLSVVKFKGIPIQGKLNQLGRLEMIIPKYSVTFEVLINGIVYSFSSTTDDIIISSDDIPEGFFEPDTDININLVLTDLTAVNYGAKLVLKPSSESLPTDTVIGILPINEETFTNGNILLTQSEFLKGEVKNGQVKFIAGEETIRVIFDTPYDIGDGTTTVIPFNSNENYSIMLTSSGNVTTFWSNKTTTGFNINLEPNTGFEGVVEWRTVKYERTQVEEELIDITDLQSLFDVNQDYSVLVQPGLNVNVWVTDVGPSGFKIVSDSSFVGPVDYLIIPETVLGNAGDFALAGVEFVPRGETEIEVKFSEERANTDYTVFLQPTGNARVFYENKTTEGFTIRVEPETDFFGQIDWQIHEGDLSNTINFGGGSILSDGEPFIEFTDLEETSLLGNVVQGLAKMTIINQNGLISSTSNGLSLEYDRDVTVNPGLSFVISKDNISYKDLRVFVQIEDTFVEFTESKDIEGTVDKDTKIFYVRVNKDKLIRLSFGNNDARGFGPSGNLIYVIGQETVGEQGNIGENVLSPEIISSSNFDTLSINTAEVLETFIDLLRIQKDVFFNGTQGSTLVDYMGNNVSNDDLKIVQLEIGLFGTEPEDIESLRENAQISHQAQERTVTNSDYKSILSSSFSEFVIDIDIFNYKQAIEIGLLKDNEKSKYHSNTLFFMMIPAHGTQFTISQRTFIKEFIDNKIRRHGTVDSIILEPTFIPIDVVILFNNKVGTSTIQARNEITNGVSNFFDRRIRKLGETITVSQIQQSIESDIITELSIMLNKDPNNEFSKVDYDVDITPDRFEDPFQDTQRKKLQDAVNTELRNLVGKGLIQLRQPIFDIQFPGPEGKRSWPFSGSVELERFQFPVLGDLVLERRVRNVSGQ